MVVVVKLLEVPGVFVDIFLIDVGYFYLVFDDYEIILVEGVEMESFLIGSGIMKLLGVEVVKEFIFLFLYVGGGEVYMMLVCLILFCKWMNKLMVWYMKNKCLIVV